MIMQLEKLLELLPMIFQHRKNGSLLSQSNCASIFFLLSHKQFIFFTFLLRNHHKPSTHSFNPSGMVG